jgi:protein involved in polysaccharide export with SLBB domain
MTTKQLGKTAGIWLLAGLSAGLLLTGCKTGDDAEFSSLQGQTNRAAPNAASGARFAVGDSVTVTFSGITPGELPPEEQTIKEDGTITLHLLQEPVQAAGKTPGELQNDICEKYKPLYNHLTVSVTSPQRVFYVDGEVKAPNRWFYIGETTVLKAIASSGGFTDFAKKTKVQLTRAGSKKPIIIDCKKALQNPALDLPVYPGDKIYVPRRLF